MIVHGCNTHFFVTACLLGNAVNASVFASLSFFALVWIIFLLSWIFSLTARTFCTYLQINFNVLLMLCRIFYHHFNSVVHFERIFCSFYPETFFVKVCPHLTCAFVSTSASPWKFNIASVVTEMQRMDLHQFSAIEFAMLKFDGHANADVKCEQALNALNCHALFTTEWYRLSLSNCMRSLLWQLFISTAIFLHQHAFSWFSCEPDNSLIWDHCQKQCFFPQATVAVGRAGEGTVEPGKTKLLV